jgi:hypothetical protein
MATRFPNYRYRRGADPRLQYGQAPQQGDEQWNMQSLDMADPFGIESAPVDDPYAPQPPVDPATEPQTVPPPPPQGQSPQAPQYPRYTPISQTGGPDITSADDQRQAQQDRIAAQHAGNALDQDLTDYLNTQTGRSAGYEGQLAQQYQPFLEGGGGYTPDEQAQINGQDRLAGMQLSQEERDLAYLSPDEQVAITGNAEAGQEYFQPDRERATASRGSTAQRAAVDQMSGDLDAATDYEKMSVRAGYGDDLQGNVESTAGNVRDVLGGPNMEVSDEFLSDYQMTPEEQQGIITSAGMDVRNRFQSQIGDMQRKARAEGVNAAGAAAMSERLMRQAAAQGGDQMTRARVAADAEAARRMQTGEDMRVGYGQRAGAMRSGAELSIGNMGERSLTEAERARLGAESDFANQRSRNVATAGTARLNTERGVANTELANEQRFTDQGIALEQREDEQRRGTATQIALNRQASLAHNQQQDTSRRQYADQATTARTVANANARRTDQQEARGYLGGQQQQANLNQATAMNQRIQNQGQTNAARVGSTGNLIGANGTPGRGERIIGGVLGAAGGAAAAWAGAPRGGGSGGGAYEKGGVITKPTYALLGEHGPEAVVPLGYEDEAEVLPSVALSAMQPGSFDTAPPPMRGQSAYNTRYSRRAA